MQFLLPIVWRPIPPNHSILPILSYSFLPASTLLSHASCSLSGDSSSVMTVNSSVLPFSWIFSLFMRVTISCSLSWAWELDAAAPFPSPSLGVIIRVWCLPHQLQKQAHIRLLVIYFLSSHSLRQNMWEHSLLTTAHREKQGIMFMSKTCHTCFFWQQLHTRGE